MRTSVGRMPWSAGAVAEDVATSRKAGSRLRAGTQRDEGADGRKAHF